MHRPGAGVFIGRMSDVLLLHRHGVFASGFFVCLSGILFVQLCRCDSFTPRGGGQRDRRRTLRSPSPISPTPLNLFPGLSAAAGLIIAAAGLQGYSLCNSGAFACRHFDVVFGGFVFGLVSLAFQSGSWACVVCFSFVLMEKRRRWFVRDACFGLPRNV